MKMKAFGDDAGKKKKKVFMQYAGAPSFHSGPCLQVTWLWEAFHAWWRVYQHIQGFLARRWHTVIRLSHSFPRQRAADIAREVQSASRYWLADPPLDTSSPFILFQFTPQSFWWQNCISCPGAEKRVELEESHVFPPIHQSEFICGRYYSMLARRLCIDRHWQRVLVDVSGAKAKEWLNGD